MTLGYRRVGKILIEIQKSDLTQALDPKQCLFTNLGCKLEPRREGLVESIWESCGDIRVASWRHLEASWKHLGGIHRRFFPLAKWMSVGTFLG